MRVNNLIPGFRFVDHFRITNPPTTDGYAVPFTLTYIPGSDPFFCDILPYANDQVLPFWIEHAAGTTISTNTPFTSPKIWIRLPKGCTDLDIYRKNPRMTADRSDGNRTFDFFDDFLGEAIDTGKWDKTGTVSVSGGNAVVGAGSAANILGKTTFAEGYSMRSRTKSSADFINLIMLVDSLSYTYIIDFERYNGNANFGLNTNYGFTASDLAKDTSYHIMDLFRNVTDHTCSGLIDGSHAVSKNSANTPTAALKPMHRTWSSGVCTVDWTLVRKYQSPEPTPILLSTKTNPMWGGK